MKSTNIFGKCWWLFGLASVLSAFLVRYIGWFAITNAAAMGACAYVLHLAAERVKRIEKARGVMKKASAKAKEQMAKLDDQELQQIYALSKTMVPFVTFGSLAINLYTCWYYGRTGQIFSPVQTGMSQTVLLAIDALNTAGMFLSFYVRVKEILTEA
ncbi:MAG: hypothetical protein HUJ55_02160 [Ileibacterium sp.]|nr:hypothetical protein [Ileibacterium sp.]